MLTKTQVENCFEQMKSENFSLSFPKNKNSGIYPFNEEHLSFATKLFKENTLLCSSPLNNPAQTFLLNCFSILSLNLYKYHPILFLCDSPSQLSLLSQFFKKNFSELSGLVIELEEEELFQSNPSSSSSLPSLLSKKRIFFLQHTNKNSHLFLLKQEFLSKFDLLFFFPSLSSFEREKKEETHANNCCGCFGWCTCLLKELTQIRSPESTLITVLPSPLLFDSLFSSTQQTNPTSSPILSFHSKQLFHYFQTLSDKLQLTQIAFLQFPLFFPSSVPFSSSSSVPFSSPSSSVPLSPLICQFKDFPSLLRERENLHFLLVNEHPSSDSDHNYHTHLSPLFTQLEILSKTLFQKLVSYSNESGKHSNEGKEQICELALLPASYWEERLKVEVREMEENKANVQEKLRKILILISMDTIEKLKQSLEEREISFSLKMISLLLQNPHYGNFLFNLFEPFLQTLNTLVEETDAGFHSTQHPPLHSIQHPPLHSIPLTHSNPSHSTLSSSLLSPKQNLLYLSLPLLLSTPPPFSNPNPNLNNLNPNLNNPNPNLNNPNPNLNNPNPTARKILPTLSLHNKVLVVCSSQNSLTLLSQEMNRNSSFSVSPPLPSPLPSLMFGFFCHIFPTH